MPSATTTATVAFLFVASLASAQFTSECTSALGAIAVNSDANACLSPATLLPLAAASGNESIIDPINQWVTNICTRGACNNDTLAAIVRNVTSGCSAELGTLGFDTSQTESVIATVQEAYPTVRQVMCLKTGDDYCLTDTLNALQDSFGTTLSVNSIVSLGASSDTTIPTSIYCSDCAKAAYTILKADYPSLVSESEADIQSECGASFTDGNSPDGISETAPEGLVAAPTDNDSAFLQTSIGSQMAIVSGLLTLLAV